ncbi:MAG: prohead protease/major capsid protein fusion protein [Acetobacteraceae bacterium]
MSEVLTRRATFAPATWDEAERAVEVVWTTGAAVERRDARGPFLEVLDVSPGAVDLSRFEGAPVLNAHRQASTRDVLGVVEAPRIEAGRGIARIRFSERPEVQPIVADVRAGVLRYVSVGYRVTAWREGKDSSGRRTMTAAKWQPVELSLVPVPADPGALIRGAIVETVTEAPAAPEPAPAQNRAEVNREIRSIAEATGLGRAWADSHIDAETKIDDVRREALAELAKRSAAASAARPTIRVGASAEDPALRRAAMVDGLAARILNLREVPEPARPYAQMSFAAIARDVLERAGESTFGLSEGALTLRAMATSSDFVGLLADAAGKISRAAYEQAPIAVRAVARQVSVTRLHDVRSSALSEARPLTELNEGAEIPFSPLAEATARYSLRTYGAVFNLSRRALANDDAGAFAAVARRMGESASEAEASLFAAMLAENGGDGPLIAGSAMFSTSRGTKASTAAAIGDNSLADARAALRSMKGPNGQPVNVVPRFLVVPPALETAAERWVATALVPSSASNVNPFAGMLTVVVEPRLASATRWYLFAGPEMSNFELARVAGLEAPRVETRPGWGTDAIEWRVVHDFGLGAVDWRGAFMNPGA